MNQKNLEEYNGPDRIVSSYEVEESLALQDNTSPFVCKSGIPSLDNLTDGYRGGELVVVSGPTGEGKSLLMQTMTEHMTGIQSLFPLWFSFEMPHRQFLKRFPSVPYFYMPLENKPYSWDWFVDRCEENELKHRGKIIIIDHLHFLMDFLRSKHPSLEIGQLMRRLKTLVNDTEYLIFLIAHIQKIDEGVKASMRNIRDSSFIAQEADTVIMVQRVLDETNTGAVLTVDKCRETGAFGRTVNVNKIGGYLRELA